MRGEVRRWLAATAVNLGTLPPPLDTGLVAAILPALSRDLHAHITVATWVPIIYLLVISVFMPTFGALSDRLGRREFFAFGLLVFALGAFLSGSSQTIYELLFARLVQGVGAAFVLANSRALISDLFGEGRGLAMGVHIAVLYFALLMGPLLGGVILTLTSVVGWRDVFFVNIPICVASATLTVVLVPRSNRPVRSSGRLNWFRAVLLFFGLLALIGGVSMWTMTKGTIELLLEEVRFFGLYTRPFFYVSFPAWVPVLAGAALTTLTLLSEWKSESDQVIPLRLLKVNTRLRSACVSILLLYTAHHATWVLLSFYLTVVKGMDPIETGMTIAVLPLTVLVISPLGGLISDRYGHVQVMTFGLFVSGTSLLMLSFGSADTSILFIAVSLVLLGMGIGTFAAPNTNTALESVQPEVRAQVNGLLGFMRHIGQTLSLVFASMVMDLSIGYEKFLLGGEIDISSFVKGMDTFFLIGSGLSLTAAAFALYYEVHHARSFLYLLLRRKAVQDTRSNATERSSSGVT
ncbi:MAG: MFS transporter [Aigarchaeota archaeon]|nr:MFS transporter [Candidatus Calditenuis fumarioli]